MLPSLRDLRRLYLWAFSTLTEGAVAVPWTILCYADVKTNNWPEAMAPIWILWVAYAGAGLWEAGGGAGKGQKRPWQRVLEMVGGLAVIYGLTYYRLPVAFRTGLLTVNPAWAVLPAAGYLWYQGVRSAVEGIHYGRIYGRFIWQMAGLVGGIAALLLMDLARDSRIQLLLWWSILLFFAAGLMLMALTRERSLRQGQAKLGETAQNQSTSSLVGGVILLLALLSLLASSILSFDRLTAAGAAIGSALSRPYNWLLDVVMLIVYRWIAMLLAVVALYQRLVPHRPPPPQEQQDDQNAMNKLLDELRKAPPRSIEPYMPYVKVALLLIAIAVVAVLLYRMNRAIQDRRAEQEEERISLGFWRNFLADLASLLGLVRRAPKAVVAAMRESAAPEGPRDARALFRRLQAYGLFVGRPRRHQETPNTFRTQLSLARPEAEGAAAAVTAVYNEARYGAHPPAAEAVEQAAAALNKVQGK